MTLQEMIEYEKEESYKEGISEGISKGISDGIAALIHTCREFNISDEQILESVMREYNLSREKAEIHLKATSN